MDRINGLNVNKDAAESGSNFRYVSTEAVKKSIVP